MRWHRWLRRVPAPLTSQQAYARWAATYPPVAHNPFMQAEEAAMLALLLDVSDRLVLDLACGSGRYTQIVQARGAQTLSVDDSWAMLVRAPLSGAIQATMLALPLAGAMCDIVVCGLAVGHLRQLDRVYAEMGRVLRKGGIALISDLHPFQTLGGAQRTFTDEAGQTFAVEHYLHLLSDHMQAAQQAGFILEAVHEPGLITDGPPVVLVLRWRLV